MKTHFITLDTVPRVPHITVSRLALTLAALTVASARLSLAATVSNLNDGGTVSFNKLTSSARLLVVAPQAFSAALEPLVTHKNKTGMPAAMITIEALRDGFAGADDPEKIKRGIAWAHEKLDTQYVMLVGDAGLIPVRYRQVQQESKEAPLDGTYNPSELYYANLYHGHTPGPTANDPSEITASNVFDTWDQNGNGRYNEQQWNDNARSYNPDQVDGCPDVALGRVPAHTVAEVQIYVSKVVRYETGRLNSSNFGDFAFIADTHYAGSQGMCDDIIVDSVLRAFPTNIKVDRMLLNCGAKPALPASWRIGSFAAVDTALARSWWITYLGHSSPKAWSIFEAGRAYDETRVKSLRNATAFPIVFSIGCESGMFMTYAPSEKYRDQQGHEHHFIRSDNRSWRDSLTGQTIEGQLTVPQPSPYDYRERGNRTFACSWLFQPAGGAIVYFGETLVCENDKGHDLEKELFLRYRAGDRILGDLWRNGQRKYWLNNRTSENVFRHPRIYLGIMTLFGDPSLRLSAGAFSEQGSREEIPSHAEGDKQPNL